MADGIAPCGSAGATGGGVLVRHPSDGGHRASGEGRTADVFVGREPELAAVLEAVDVDRFRHAEVRGPTGIGKSRFLAELHVRLASLGADVETVAAGPGRRAIPFAPFAHLIDSSIPSSTPTEHLSRLLAALRRRSASGWFVLLVDDAHRLDEPSTQLVQQVMRLPVSVVFASRTGEGTDALLRSEVARTGGPSFQLPVLTRRECGVLAEAVLGAPVHDGAVAELERVSAGLPFVAIELIEAGRDRGSLLQEADTTWRLVGRIETPPRVRDVVNERLARLSDQARRLLDVLAVAGPLPLSMATDLVDVDEIGELEAVDLLRTVRTGSPPATEVELGHDLYRDVLLDGPCSHLLDARRTAVRVLDDATDDSPRLLLLRARLALESGTLAPGDAIVAARVALHVWDGDLAVELATRAGGSVEARTLLAAALGASGRIADAEATFRTLEATTSGVELAHVLAEHAMLRLLQCADPIGALERLEWGREHCGPEGEDLVRSTLATIQFFAGRIRDAIATASPLLDDGHRFPPDAGPALASSWAVIGDPDGVLRTWCRTWDGIRRSSADHSSIVGLNLVWCRLLALLQLGRAQEGDDPLATVPHDIWWPARDSSVIGESMEAAQAALRGHLDDAAARYALVEDELRVAPTQVLASNAALLAQVHASLGDPDGARRTLGWIADTHPDALLAFRWWIDRARAWISVAEGDLAAGIERSIELADRHDGEWLYVTLSLHDVVRLGRAERVLDALVAAAGRRGATWLDRVCRDHAIAATTSDAAALLRVSEHFEAGGLELLAMEAAADATRSDSVTPGEQVDAEERIARLGERCGPARTPALETAPRVLTDREVEVARLAARGWTNPRIGERLGTSARTVGNQLQSVYQKLNINSRDELLPLFPAGSASWTTPRWVGAVGGQTAVRSIRAERRP